MALHVFTIADSEVAVTPGESTTSTAPERPGAHTITCLLHGSTTATLVAA